MATYIVLSSFTDQGIRTVKDTTKRADAVRELARKMGIETKSLYWTVGKYDVVATFEAPDDAAMTALSLALSSSGNVRTQTMRAFSKDEMGGILSKLG
ncbi:MAG: GYD domain-containing protein [Pseudomonadota bacterium]|nr:GYD domain-containing protein [Pseudomonadota bacterium]